MKNALLVIAGFLSGVLVTIACTLIIAPMKPSVAHLIMGIIISASVSGYIFMYLHKGRDSANKRHLSAKRVAITMSLFVISLTGIWLIHFLIQSRSSKLDYQQSQLEIEKLKIQATRQSGNTIALASLLEQIYRDLNNNDARTLSKTTVRRIADFSKSLEPYTFHDGDTTITASPERGQLLLSLSNMDIDSATMVAVLSKTTFAFADLRNSDLSSRYLPHARLENAFLQNSNLDSSFLQSSILANAVLSGAKMNHANLSHSDLKRAILDWAELNHSNLSGADLSSCKMRSARLRNAKMTDVKIQWADLESSFFTNAVLSGADLFGTNLTESHFENANLINAYMRRTQLRGIDLTNAKMDSVYLLESLVEDTSWLTNLDQWQVTGASEIRANNRVVDTIFRGKRVIRIDPARR